MVEGMDPFEAAMASMNKDSKSDIENTGSGDKGSTPADGEVSNTSSSGDQFDAALASLEKETSGNSDSAPEAVGGSGDAFDAALAEMGAVSNEGGSIESASKETETIDDPFAAALEVAKTEHSVAETQGTVQIEGQEIDIDFLMEIKVNLTFEVGRTKMFISDLLSLGQGSVIELHRLVGEELDIFVNGQLLATGEVVVVNEKFGARLVNILSPEERLERLSILNA